ncbi:MAG TPA: hypothetical protein DDY31_08400, partial [Lachnospiraceae bacterium]|nr:hypothetical protein [Lachnospiraceae bacterium]
MSGAIGNTHWNIDYRSALCGGTESGNTGSGIYQKNTTMDNLIYEDYYGGDTARVFDGCFCRNYDDEKL